MKNIKTVKIKPSNDKTWYQHQNTGLKLYTLRDMKRIYRQGASDGMGTNHPKDLRYMKDLNDLEIKRVKEIESW